MSWEAVGGSRTSYRLHIFCKFPLLNVIYLMHIFYGIGILSICVIRKDISLVLKNSDLDLKEVLKTEYVSVGIF